MQNIKIFVPSLKGDPLALWYHFINLYLLYLFKNKQIFNNGLHRFHNMLFKEFLTEINSNKTKQNLRKPTITDRQTKVKRKKNKRTNNDLQNTTQIAKINEKPGVNSGVMEGLGVSLAIPSCYGQLTRASSDT